MPLTSTEKAMPRPGESRKIGPRSMSTSRDSSQQRATLVPNSVHQRNHDDGRSRRLSSDKADALRVDLPDTLAPSRFKSSRPGKDSKREEEQETARRVKAEPFASGRVSRLPVTNQAAEDDTATTSLTFNDTGWESDQDIDGQRTAVLRADWTDRLVGGAVGGGGGGGGGGDENGLAPSLDGFSDVEYAYGDDPLHDLSRETPSRTGVVAASVPVPVPMPTKPATRRRVDFFFDKDSSPIDEEFEKGSREAQARPQQAVNVQSSLARHAEHRQEVRYSTPASASAPAPVSLAQPSKVAASSDEGPADGDHQPQNDGTKRTHEELDYDADELVGKSYSDLDAMPFLADPRAPIPPTSQDNSSGSSAQIPTRSIDAQLEKLSHLPTADQVRLFQSLSEAENEQTGTWFAAWFGASVKQAQQLRLQRRKIALKYEMEARKRQRAVEVKMAECEAQLAEMKQGGSKLVEGRSADKLGMTPRRETKLR